MNQFSLPPFPASATGSNFPTKLLTNSHFDERLKKWRQEESVRRSWLLKPYAHRSKSPILRSLVSGQHPTQTNKQKAYSSKQKPMALPRSPWLESAYWRLNSTSLQSPRKKASPGWRCLEVLTLILSLRRGGTIASGRLLLYVFLCFLLPFLF